MADKVSPSVLVDTLPPNVQDLERVADLVPKATGFALTMTVQEDEVFKFAVPHVPPVMEKSEEFVPPILAAEQPVAFADPEFEIVKV